MPVMAVPSRTEPGAIRRVIPRHRQRLVPVGGVEPRTVAAVVFARDAADALHLPAWVSVEVRPPLREHPRGL